MNVSKQTIFTILVLLLILAVAIWATSIVLQKKAQRALQESPAGKALESSPSVTAFTDFDGNTANLEQYLGQVLIVNSWASWSPFSGAELQLLTSVADSYESGEVIVLAINRGENILTAQQYLETIDVAASVHLIVDKDDRYYKSINGYTMPETVFYDRAGNEIAHERGALTAESVRSHIDTALSQPAD